MEEILSKLLVADNATIQQGTKELREAFKTPEVIPALCNVIGVSQNPQIRQYAAVLLRRRLSKNKNWMKLSVDVRNGIKQGILQALVNEPERFVKNSIAQFIGTILRNEFPNQGWPEVLQFLQQLTSSDILSEKELGMYTLSVITEISAEQFLPHVSSMVVLFSNMLNSVEDLSSPVAFYTVISMINLVPLAERERSLVVMYDQLMPRLMQTIRALVVTNEERAVQAMDLFDGLAESATVVIVPSIKPLVDMCLEFASNKTLGDSVRVKALNFIGWLTRSKKKAVVKHKLVQSILEVLFQLMSVCPENDDNEDYFSEDASASTPMTCATETLDTLALHLPPDKLLPPLLQHVQRGLESTDVYAKRASHLALAVVVEGCSECIRTKYLQSFLQCVSKGITDSASVVRNAALFALGQFSEYLQPDISLYASQIVPVLLDYLATLCSQPHEKGKDPVFLNRIFYALEMFCENLGNELLPYLPTLMERLFAALTPNSSVRLRELALSCIGAAAIASKDGMIPYFPGIIEILKVYLNEEQSDDTICIQIQAVTTLGVLARSVGSEHFLPLAQGTVELGLNLLSKSDDPELRKSCYGLFAALSMVLKDNMRNILPTVVETMLDALQSGEGIVPQFKDDDETSALPLYDDVEGYSSDTPDEEDIETDSEEEEDEDIIGYTFDNVYVQEKEEACMALMEIAKNTGEAFVPFLQKSFEEVFKIINYHVDDIRKAAIAALRQFCVCFYEMKSPEGRVALSKALSMLIPKCAELIHTDEERTVVMTALDAYSDLLMDIKGPVLEGEGHCDAIICCVKDVMSGQTQCQDTEDDEECKSDDPEAEQDEMLVEYAGEIVPNLGKAMTPDEFSPYFSQFLPLFLSRMRKQCTVSQRSFSVGTLSQSMEPLGPRIGQFVPQLLPLFLQLTKDESDEVRNNAIYGIGEMVLHGKETLFPHYSEILQTLSVVASKEKHAGTLDNICGALARLILCNVSGVPMEQVFPVFVNYLPLREDFDENKAVFECMTYLYQLGHPLLLNHLTSVMKAGFVVLCEHQGVKETMELVLSLMKMIQLNFHNEFSSVVATLPVEYAPKIQEMFS